MFDIHGLIDTHPGAVLLTKYAETYGTTGVNLSLKHLKAVTRVHLQGYQGFLEDVNLYERRLGVQSDSGYSVTEGCTGCGICARVCPRENVRVTDRPSWNHDCDSCGSWACWCPEAAILTAGSVAATRKHHAEVSVQDFLLR